MRVRRSTAMIALARRLRRQRRRLSASGSIKRYGGAPPKRTVSPCLSSCLRRIRRPLTIGAFGRFQIDNIVTAARVSDDSRDDPRRSHPRRAAPTRLALPTSASSRPSSSSRVPGASRSTASRRAACGLFSTCGYSKRHAFRRRTRCPSRLARWESRCSRAPIAESRRSLWPPAASRDPAGSYYGRSGSSDSA